MCYLFTMDNDLCLETASFDSPRLVAILWMTRLYLILLFRNLKKKTNLGTSFCVDYNQKMLFGTILKINRNRLAFYMTLMFAVYRKGSI